MNEVMVRRAVLRFLWALGLTLMVGLAVTACGDDPHTASPSDTVGVAGANTGDGGDAGGPAVSGNGGEAGQPLLGEAGMAPVSPEDLVCASNADCKGDKPVCDPVQGCVACAFDWDCPTNHRCDGNQCFKKQTCTESKDCAHDPAHPLCDPVQSVCVGCRENTDCGDGKRCASGRCEQLETCTNSKSCSRGKVCDRSLGACVSCVVDGDCGQGNACVADACVPTCSGDKECLGIGYLCNLASGRCVECVTQNDCPASYFCGSGGVCNRDVCEQGQSHCNGSQTLSTCSLLGDEFDDATCPSDSACAEDGDKATCEPLACVPGSVVCAADKGSVVTCSADGSSVKSTVPCGLGQTCVSGACQAVICPASGYSCIGNDLYTCDSTGTTQTKSKTCATNYKCDAASGSCLAPSCYAGAAVCDGNTATVCALDGTGPAPGGTPCGAGNTCYQGQCAPLVCSGNYQCNQDGNLVKCYYGGTYAQITDYCGYPGLCDAIAGQCLTPKCTPGAFACDGSIATRCKADGTGYEAGGTDCATQNLACDGGACLPKVCTPNTTYCDGGNPTVCNPAGTTYAPSDVCNISEYCKAGSKVCLTDVCLANAPVCNGNLLTTCNADGSGYVTGGTDCSATSQLCLAGACKPIVCTKGSLSCQAEAIYQCNTTGTGTALYQSCGLSQFCDTSADVATCSPDLCVAGSLGCNQEVVSTCGSNGGSWTNPGVNCASSSQVCILGGSCAAQEVATQGSSLYTSSANGAYAGFRALIARKLTKLEVYASVSGLQKFTWFVYQKRAGSDAYDIVYQAVTAQSAPALGFVSSPVLNYSFVSGKSYAVGVHITGAATIAYTYTSSDAGNAHAAFITAPTSSFVYSTQPATSVTPPTFSYDKPYLRITTALTP